ncbi:MAG: hypothetical protein ACI89E_000391 [Planctomycetota bacterium]|jgi:hypothetical protein
MTSNFGNWDDSTLDLAIRAFTEGVDTQSLDKLHSLANAEDLESFEHSLAAVHWAHADQVSALPAITLKRLERDAELWLDSPHPSMVGARHAAPKLRPQTPWIAITGWALAASLLIVLFAKDSQGAVVLDPAGSMQALISGAADLQRLDWSLTEDPLAFGASGEVVWSDALQEGYMVFRGLQPNDPRLGQFQLWIFDPNRADWDKTPVDGGVFDVPASGEVIIPIQANLQVSDVALFAITLEDPGGVVVSKRERLLLTAQSS